MESASAVFVLAVAALAAATMGFAIQRGATCTVAAVDELLTRRRATRLASLAEASVWVGGGLLVVHALGRLAMPPGGYALGGWTVAGGALLGLGAFVNGACVFGAIARFGNGEWAYAATPLGFYAGCLSVPALFDMPAPLRLPASAAPLFAMPALLLALFAAFAAWRLAGAARAGVGGGWLPLLGARLWSPHAATGVIGVTFLATLLAAGAWAYTDLLAELARGMAMQVAPRLLLAAALLAGAAWGGRTAGRWQPAAPGAAAIARCFAGGALMGWGSLLIPGGNDGLILVGMPLGWPYAWAAIAAMCTTIALALRLRRSLESPRPVPSQPASPRR